MEFVLTTAEELMRILPRIHGWRSVGTRSSSRQVDAQHKSATSPDNSFLSPCNCILVCQLDQMVVQSIEHRVGQLCVSAEVPKCRELQSVPKSN
jgi:hypothetical protein